MISAKIIADSKNEFGNRITTMIVVMPRYILAEFNTHRMLSRNSASSRAIPFEKNLKNIQDNPFIPIAWMKDHKGMQGSEYFSEADARAEFIPANWLYARDKAIFIAKKLSEIGVTKQLVNRLLEPFMFHTVIVTATEWENFFALRCPQYNIGENNPVFRSRKDLVKDLNNDGVGKPSSVEDWDNLYWLKINKGQADIHMMAVAECMWNAFNESTPKELKVGEWHIPFGDQINPHFIIPYGTDDDSINVEDFNKYCVKIATARCARVSYTVVGEEDKPDNYEADIKLHDRLAASGHWSPFEHCAIAMNFPESEQLNPSGNFFGFIQYRKTFQNENITK